jgi:superfamily II DNA or RNA helicase
MGFQLLTPGASLPPDAHFFVLYLPQRGEIPLAEIERAIKKSFPEIPAEKLLSCKIRLVLPPNNLNRPENIADTIPVVWITGKIIPIPPAIKLLNQLRIIEDTNRTRLAQSYADSVKTWAYLTKLTIELLSRGNFVPILDPLTENRYEGKWRVLLKTYRDHQRFKTIMRNSPWISHNLAVNLIEPLPSSPSEWNTTGIWHPSYLFVEYMDNIADYLIRTSLGKEYMQQFERIYGTDPEGACSIDANSPWDLRFLRACIGKDRLFEIKKFCDTPVPGILRNWVQNTRGFSFDMGVGMTFKLEYPKSKNADWPLGFFLQPLHNPDQYIPLKDLWDGIITQNADFANACEDEGLLQEEILRALGMATKLYPPIGRSLDGRNPTQVKLTATEVMDFMRYSMYLLIQNGFNVVLPEEFAAQGQQRLTAQMIIQPKSSEKRAAPGTGLSAAPVFDMNTLLEYRWEAQIEGKTLTEDEFKQLANSREPLVFWRDHWVLVDPQDIAALQPIFAPKSATGDQKMAVSGTISYMEAMKLGMIGNVQLQEGGAQYEVKLTGDFGNILDTLMHIESFPEISVPGPFTGTLRPYQQKGLTWLAHMSDLRFGLILADDMGLGKTVQIIALLVYRQVTYPNAPGSTLIICPTSLIFNWQRELQKFGPSLEVYIHYGPDRQKDAKVLGEFARAHRVILTSYGTVRNDIELFEAASFAGIIVDEAQNIKNHKAQQTQAIYRLKGDYRICMSGTPIENRLLELWSLFEFLNPGMLGKRKDFQTNFILPIERFHDEEIITKLRKFISPFLLRRVKSDKTIIQDLPPKNEIKVYLELSPIQARLYQQVVQTTLQEIEMAENNPAKRKGLILRLLMQLKQICNHPYQYLHLPVQKFDPATQMPEDEGETVINLTEAPSIVNKEISVRNEPVKTDSETKSPGNKPRKKATGKPVAPPSPITSQEPTDSSLANPENVSNGEIIAPQLSQFLAQSTKLERLLDMVEEVLENGTKLLVFTQFKQMGDIIQKVLEEQYQFPVLFLHGGVPEKKRREMVDEFQSADLDSSPIMILSLKAGGTGLNLTQASTVFHFDRWWNPAVENQATDRAYRIGQKQQVNVYKFVSSGTIEEKIDGILEEKRSLADQIVVSGGETWITELSTDELKDLFSLGGRH